MAEAYPSFPAGLIGIHLGAAETVSDARAPALEAVVIAPLRRRDQTPLLRRLVTELRESEGVRLRVIDPAVAHEARGPAKLSAWLRFAWLALRQVRSADLVVWHGSTR